MLYSTLIVATSAFAGFASAQITNQTFNTPIPCCSVPANTVPEDTRVLWCQANKETCVDLCGGQGNIGSNGNECSDTSLTYTCNCANGTAITNDIMRNYEQSVPALECRFWFGACINATGQDAAKQFACQQARDSQCGNLTTKASDGASSSANPSSSATASRSSSSPSSTTGATAAQSSTGVAAGLATYGLPILAGGLLAVFGIAL